MFVRTVRAPAYTYVQCSYSMDLNWVYTGKKTLPFYNVSFNLVWLFPVDVVSENLEGISNKTN